jgi:hypothetical protein
MENINSLILFGTKSDNLDFVGNLIFSKDGDSSIEYIGQSLIEEETSDELILYGKIDNKKKFTAICISPIKYNTKKKIKRNVLIKRIFLGEFVEDIDNLKISNILLRTSYLENWFYPLAFDSETLTIDKNSLEIQDKIEYSSNYTLSFDYDYSYTSKNNTKVIFDCLRYVKIEAKFETKFLDLEKECKKVLNLFKFLLPSKDIYIEKMYFFVDDNKVEVLEKQFYYTKENKNNVYSYDYIITYDENESKNLIAKWFNLYEKYEIIFGYLHTIFNDAIIKVIEIKFLFFMQWIEGFCREKFPILESEKRDFDVLIENLQSHCSENSPEFEWLQDQKEYGIKQNFLKQIKDLIKELKKNGYIDIRKEDISKISKKIKDLRDELTHIEPKRKNYKEKDMVYLNHFIKGIIVYSLINELQIKKETLDNNNLQFSQIFKNYNDAVKNFFKKENAKDQM